LLFDLLADPQTTALSNLELGRRSGAHHLYVAGFRAALTATKLDPLDPSSLAGPDLGPTPCGPPRVPGGPPSGSQRRLVIRDHLAQRPALCACGRQQHAFDVEVFDRTSQLICPGYGAEISRTVIYRDGD
jgi:hypothetical protein